MSGGAGRDGERALARSFLARFFENDITGGTNDLRQSFFWLLAALAVPGFLIPVLMSFDWMSVGLVQGPAVLRHVSRPDKVLYLGLTFVATGFITAIVWQSLLIDRRDVLVIGVQPVAPSSIVRAKLRALAAFAGLLAVGTHTLSALSFAFALSTKATFGFLIRSLVAHFVASSMATLFVIAAATFAQGVALTLLGPRRFARGSFALQIGLVVMLLLLYVALPTLSLSINRALDAPAGAPSWVLYAPPIWCLGVYETILGTSDVTLVRLASIATIGLATCVAGTYVLYPVAYRRLMVAAVETAEAEGRPGPIARLLSQWPLLAHRRLPARGISEFEIATFLRADRQRLALASAAGLALAFTIPVLEQWRRLSGVWPPAPPGEVFALAPAVMLLVAVALRIGIALPADLRAAWIFETVAPRRNDARGAVWRLMFALSAMPPLMVVTPLVGFGWTWRLALTHAAVCLAVGALLVELLLFGFRSIPCAEPWHPGRARVRLMWPIYLAAFLVITRGVPALTWAVGDSPFGLLVVVVGLIVTAGVVRRYSNVTAAVGIDEDFDGVEVLNLN